MQSKSDPLSSMASLGNLIDRMTRENARVVEEFHNRLSQTVSNINLINPEIVLPDIYWQLPQIELSFVSRAGAIAADVKSIVQTFDRTWRSQVQTLTSSLNEVGKRMVADFAAMGLAWENLVSSDVLKRLQETVKAKQAEADAFCAAGWPIAPSMPSELRERVVVFHRQGRTRYASQAVLGYYRKQNHVHLIEVVQSWQHHPLIAPRFHILLDALEAHRARKYTLSVPALLPQIEGILTDYVKNNNLVAKFGKITQVYTAAIGDVNDYGLAEWAIVQTLLHLLQTDTYKNTKFEDELKKSRLRRKTTRHTVLHGVATQYHRQAHSLRPFLLIDAISVLE